MRLLSLVFMLVLAVSASATELWRWVDDSGVVHYSDRPVPGAERVEIRGAQTFSAPPVADSAPAAAGEQGNAEDDSVYERLAIVRPNQDETFWNIEGRLDVSVDVQPAIRGHHALKLFLDGQPVEGVPPAATSFTLGNVFRGEHTLRAALVDENGRQLISSDPVRFFVKQTSLLNPNNPNTSPPGPRPTPLPSGGG